jgi:glycosyltransferase involved in cell wall biosynthesis
MSASASPSHPRPVLHVHNNADLYGSSRSLLRWVRTVDRKQFEPFVVLPMEGPLKSELEAAGVVVMVHRRLSVLNRPAFASWRLILFLVEYPFSVAWLWWTIRRLNIQLVHTNTGVVTSPAMAAWLAGVPHVWHIRDWFQEFRQFWPVYARYITAFSKRVVAVSNAIALQFKRQEKIQVIHNGFDIGDFELPSDSKREEMRRHFGVEADAFVVGCVGRIKLVRKGQEILVQATGILKGRGRIIRALIVGAPFAAYQDHLVRLQELARELGVAEQVIFTGELADPRPAYAAMDVLAMTSVQPEPFGGVVMEGMAMALPVVATNLGGSLDQVKEGVTGFLVSPGDAEALANAIERLMQDRALCRRMGNAGRERIRDEFSLTELTRELERLFEDVIAARP